MKTIEAPRAWGVLLDGARLSPQADGDREVAEDVLAFNPNDRVCRVRVIREADYRWLLKFARKGGMM